MTVLNVNSVRKRESARGPKSLLEQILECCARIHRPRRTWRGCFLFHPYAHRIKRTVIALVFSRNPFRNRLRTLEPPRSIEICTLPARVQFESALRTFSDWFGYRAKQSAALGAARHSMRARHLQCTWAKGFFFRRALAGLLFAFFAAVLIAVLAILTVRHQALLNAADIVSLRANLDKSIAQLQKLKTEHGRLARPSEPGCPASSERKPRNR